VLGVGEVHAPRGATVPSAAKRFTEGLLPLLRGRASDLLVELMMPPAGCTDAVAEVRREEEPVTSQHAEHAQNEYLAMGEAARAIGIVPDMLRPTCADMTAIEHAAGDDALDVSLRTIARLSGQQAARLVERDGRSPEDRGKMVVVYGGSLHDDLDPPEGATGWSYAPDLDAFVHGRFAAVNLVVPEFIDGSEVWTALPWWSAYEALRSAGAGSGASAGTSVGARAFDPAKATLFRTGSKSFVILLPKTLSVGISAAPGPP
jgi:hypothetical protein